MCTLQQQVHCKLWLTELKSVTHIQHHVQHKYNVDALMESVLQWDRKQTNGSEFWCQRLENVK